ncbi:V-type ATPase 116kDa subunit family protein [Streptomyces sp. NPDC048623]|uniref:V-type ATPase 116kDa subunit family protein n=1 Tax=Streptomyces sp. NPDC048623 TaxID=3155761 RepID=UPI003424E3C3
MTWSAEHLLPVRMRRVALVAPTAALRDTLVRVADAGCVELDRVEPEQMEPVRIESGAAPGAATPSPGPPSGTGPSGTGPSGTGPFGPGAGAVLAPAAPDLDALRRERREDLLAGEAQLAAFDRSAVRRGEVAALTGWCPATDVRRLSERLAAVGASVVVLPAPRDVEPPTLLRGSRTPKGSFTDLVTTYGAVPYRDVDPSWPSGVVFVVMFGVMFGDVGYGLLLLLLALALRRGVPALLARYRRLWPFLAGAGTATVLAGIAYGEFFGPTGILPVLWLDPLDAPERLLTASIVFGGLLLALAYVAGTVNRWREGGPVRAVYAPSGCAGFAVYTSLALLGAGLYLDQRAYVVAGAALAPVGLLLSGAGFFAATPGGAAGAAETGVRLFEVVVRAGTNTVSFARLAAFGLTHAALADVIWTGTTGLARQGPVPFAAAVVLFTVATAAAFALEALVAGVQALRLEFYELFSRVFEAQGHPFRPWHVPIADSEVTT